MKHKFLTLLVLPALMLSACDSPFIDTGTQKKLTVYDLDSIDNRDSLETATQLTVKARFKRNKGYVPYVSLEQYASFYNSHFDKGIVSTVKNEGIGSIVWTIYKGEDLYFASEINLVAKAVVLAGSLSATFKAKDNPQDLTVLSYGIQTEYDGQYLSSRNYCYYDFYGYDIDYIRYNGDYYLPLTFLDLTYCDDSSVYFYYNYENIYSAYEVDTFSEKEFVIDGKEYTVDSQMKKANTSTYMPRYLKELNANMFFYVMDNFYGLKEDKGFESMKSLCRNKYGIYDAMLSDNSALRAQAYADALSLLDDNHTALVSANDAWGENEFGNFRYARNCINRYTTRDEITPLRKSIYQRNNKQVGDIVISNDGLTAMYVLDSFIFGSSEEVFNNDGSINYESARKVDTFFDILYVLNYLKTTSVKNVIFDLSTNGGGVIGVLMKLLCLISKDNKSVFYYYEGSSTQLASATSKIDINDDGEYDERDCFGNDFNFYLLTSDCSFSCGNAFPCYAQIAKSAKIIGKKSGGGECAIGIHYLPNSQYVYHSSNLHIGNFNENTEVFTGFENGATPDISISSFNDFYDVETLNNLVKNSQ